MRCAVRGHLIKVPGTKIQHHYKGSVVKLGKQKIRVLKLSSGTLGRKLRIFTSFGKSLQTEGVKSPKAFLERKGFNKNKFPEDLFYSNVLALIANHLI